MIGVSTVGVEKKERLVASEAVANAQLTEASANVYLQARNQQLELLNAVLGTEIKATFNQQAYEKLVKLQDINDNNDQQLDIEKYSVQIRKMLEDLKENINIMNLMQC